MTTRNIPAEQVTLDEFEFPQHVRPFEQSGSESSNPGKRSLICTNPKSRSAYLPECILSTVDVLYLGRPFFSFVMRVVLSLRLLVLTLALAVSGIPSSVCAESFIGGRLSLDNGDGRRDTVRLHSRSLPPPTIVAIVVGAVGAVSATLVVVLILILVVRSRRDRIHGLDAESAAESDGVQSEGVSEPKPQNEVSSQTPARMPFVSEWYPDEPAPCTRLGLLPLNLKAAAPTAESNLQSQNLHLEATHFPSLTLPPPSFSPSSGHAVAHTRDLVPTTSIIGSSASLGTKRSGAQSDLRSVLPRCLATQPRLPHLPPIRRIGTGSQKSSVSTMILPRPRASSLPQVSCPRRTRIPAPVLPSPVRTHVVSISDDVTTSSRFSISPVSTSHFTLPKFRASPLRSFGRPKQQRMGSFSDIAAVSTR
ncbi:unnamed protein product [Mycena citricolor]|uniref:Transmembrane protein n=1 Tax=Mycena citricolor TaxID=2018698 RepID=A0AAD2HI36_9AGAR|nr:unnamed protein product [Mycena citricolor]CAK5276298.1 unnamed protein product [Mycena citricolor]